MTDPRAAEPATFLDLLCGTTDASPKAAADYLVTPALQHNPRTLAGVPGALRPAATAAVALAITGLLGFSLIELVVDGWREHHDLTAAARRTLARPGTTELVQLATHTITATRQPHIDVYVNNNVVATVELEVTVVFEISALIAGVDGGKLTALHSGRCLVTGTLAIQGTEVLTRQARIEPSGVFSLAEGIRLLPEQEYARPRRASSFEAGKPAVAERTSTQTMQMIVLPAEGESISTQPPAASEQWLPHGQDYPG
jgi:hypothetical protein